MFKRLRMWDRALMPGRDDACDYNEKLFDVLKTMLSKFLEPREP
jgi:hypothetical protein